jgi:photosystem II stability/assembly factor-like uncharacterized protein
MTADRLYPLLPAIYRLRDDSAGEPLRALLAVLASELDVLETDIDALYDQWFIETCGEWVVPYIGDLLDVRELYVENARLATFGRQERRAFVANTLAYRRRKGTAPVLEQLTRDLTGWSARVVEVVDRLTTTTHLDHPRPHSGWVDIRQANRADQVGTPFEQLAAYTPEIRRATGGQGRYHRRQVNLFLWRLVTYPIGRSTARAVHPPTGDPRCYTFDPTGGSFPLFNQPQPEIEITRLAAEINVPGKLRRMALADELQGRAEARQQGQSLPQPSYFGEPNPPVLQVFINGQPRPIPTDEILITPLNPSGTGEQPWLLPAVGDQFPTKVVAIDPEQGRLAFLDETVPSRVEVSYAYGFSGDVGSGPYEHADESGIPLEPSHPLLTWEIEQDHAATANPLATAVAEWNGIVQAWEGLRRQSLVPVARLTLPAARIAAVPPTQPLRPALQAGILKGLAVTVNGNTTQVSIAPGVAVDGQGRVMTITQRKTIKLTDYAPIAATETIRVGIVLAYRAAVPHDQLHLLPEAVLDQYPAGSFVLLAVATLSNPAKQVQDLDLSDRRTFSPGLVTGLTVVLNPGPPDELLPPPLPGMRRSRMVPALSAVITAGLAVDGRGRAIALAENQVVDLRSYQGQTVWLVIASQRRLGQPAWQIKVVPLEEIGQFPAAIYQPLAQLNVPTIAITDPVLPPPVPTQQPLRVNSGIVHGLTVTAPIGSASVTIAPGLAIDPQTNILQSDIHYRVNLRRHANQTVLLVMTAVDVPRPPRWRVQALAPDDPAVAMGVTLARITLNRSGRILSPPDPTLRQSCPPGIVRGLTVTTMPNGQVKIAAGIALTGDRLVTLDRPCQVDLSHYPGQTLTLFIGDPVGVGWPELSIQSPKLGSGWQHIGVVPEEPLTAKTGMITVQDHRTYPGDLTVVIPSLRQLWLRSTDNRPHLLGNLTVQGIASTLLASPAEPSTFTLDGWLVEGQLTVAPGTLKRLHLLYATLVPPAGGIVVEQAIATPPADPTELTNWSIALVLYWINQIQRLMGMGLSGGQRSPQAALGELLDLAQQQVGQVFTTLRQLFQSDHDCCAAPGLAGQNWPRPDFPGHAPNHSGNLGNGINPSDQFNNNQLSIILYRSICGAIQLPETIPVLRITDSVVDHITGTDKAAIIAPGTAVEVNTTTIFGRTIAASIEASNSIFTAKVWTERRQLGCLRFCYLPENSPTPRRYRCQPDLALSEALNQLPAPITAIAIDPHTNTILAGTAGNGIFRSTDAGQTWLLSSPAHLHITALFAQVKPSPITISSQGRQVTSRSMAVPVALKVGDELTVATQTRLVEALYLTLNAAFIPDLALGTPFLLGRNGTGTIASVDVQVTGSGTAFTTELRIGDRLQVGDQISTVAAINSPTKLTLDRAFAPNLPLGTPFTRLRSDGGRIFSTGQLATDRQPQFNPEIQVGDQLIAASQTRTITGFTLTIATAFEADLPPGTACAITRSGSGTITSQTTNIMGTGTQFLQDLNIGDAIAAGNQIRTVVGYDRNSPATGLIVDAPFDPPLSAPTPFTIPPATIFYAGITGGEVLRSPDGGTTWVNVPSAAIQTDIVAFAAYDQPGQGTIASQGITVTGTQLTDLTIGSTLTAAAQTRTITKIINATTLEVSAPWSRNLPPGTRFSQAVRLAATAGDGVFSRSSPAQPEWIAANVGLTQRQLTGLAVSAPGRVFASTAGGGLFRLQPQSKPGVSQWEAVNSGLLDRNITALAIDADGRLLVGTQSGQIWRSTDHGNLWTLVYPGTIGVDITALLAHTISGTGTITSGGPQVTGNNTQFQAEFPVGSTIRILDQARIVTAVTFDTALTLNAPFESDVVSATPVSRNRLLAGTANGRILQSIDNGHHWTEIYRDLTQTDITCLARNASAKIVVAGTSVGNILVETDRWLTQNQGLINVDEKLLILDRLQPQFTARQYGDPGYGQLSLTSAAELRTGAEDGSEMGVFNYLQQPQREAALRVSLAEYLRFGLELGIFHIT